MIRLKFSFGPYEVIVEGQREHEIFKQASLWGEIAAQCVGRKQVVLKHRMSQGFDFYEVLDAATGERLQFGQRKEDNGLFPKGWQPPYNAQQLPPAPPPQYQQPSVNVPRNPPPQPQYRQAAPQTVNVQSRTQTTQQFRPPPPQPQEPEPTDADNPF